VEAGALKAVDKGMLKFCPIFYVFYYIVINSSLSDVHGNALNYILARLLEVAALLDVCFAN
jgi:hypothetical protein